MYHWFYQSVFCHRPRRLLLALRRMNLRPRLAVRASLTLLKFAVEQGRLVTKTAY